MTIRRRLRHLSSASVASAALMTLSACETEEKLVKYRPFFTGISGAETETQAVTPSGPFVDPAQANNNRIVIENEDGTRTFIARAPKHVMTHVERLLDEDDPKSDEVLLDQLISEKTQEFYRSQGKEPISFIADLHVRRKDIAQVFARMPLGENTPTVMLEQPGDNIWVLKLTGAAAKNIAFTKIWFRVEKSQWKLMWMA